MSSDKDRPTNYEDSWLISFPPASIRLAGCFAPQRGLSHGRSNGARKAERSMLSLTEIDGEGRQGCVAEGRLWPLSRFKSSIQTAISTRLGHSEEQFLAQLFIADATAKALDGADLHQLTRSD